ncbi:MAG: transposase family protein [Chloroflexi bacterium]|nr:MAG: transposase family protein [Chloroflexota bacterium]
MIDRKKYTKEFKLEAIRMYENSERPASDIEHELAITPGLLARWKQKFEKVPRKEEAFPGNGKMMDTDARIRQMEREIFQLRQDKEILKKVLEMFSKEGK